MKIKILFLSFVAALMSGCSFNGFFADDDVVAKKNVVIQKIDKDDLREVIKKEKLAYDTPAEINFSAVGEGIAPINVISYAQAQTLAKRAAIADAQAQLAGKLYGVRINGQDSVRDAMLKDSSITVKVQGMVKNATIVDESFKNGLYRVEMQLKIDQNKWQEVFAY